MLLETISLQKAVALATPIAKKIFAKKISPIVEARVDQYFKNKTAEKNFSQNSIKYIARIVGQCSTMNTIAFQNAPKRLEDLYIPLTLVAEVSNKKILIDDRADAFQDHNHVLINDTAGMGKSTLAKRIALNIISAGEYVPVFVELRQLSTASIDRQIRNIFGIPDGANNDLIKELPLVYIFDGLDEVATDKKKNVVALLKEFVEYVGDSKVLITSRQETYLSEFYSFSRYLIQPLSRNEACALLRKYDPTGDLAKKLITGINHDGGKMIREFLSTPLYVSLLFCSYRHKTVIPRKKDLFYSQVYDALFESHDLSKEIGFVRPKYSKLDSTEFHSVLRRLGFWCLKNNGKIEFQKDELEIVVRDLMKDIAGMKSNASEFVKDLTTTVPLFVREGPTLRWSHKSLMEYFAAMFICFDTKAKQKAVLLKVFESENAVSYKNILSLCCDIDFSSFRASILRSVLAEFLEFRKSAYRNFPSQRISNISIETRVGFSFGRVVAFEIIDMKTDPFFNVKGRGNARVLLGLDPRKFANTTETVWHLEPIGLHAVECRTLSAEILEMVQNKVPDIFLSSQPESDARKIVALRVKKNKFYFVDDDPASPANRVGVFDSATRLMGKFGLNFLEVEKELAAINNDASNGVDSLLENL